MKIQAPAVNISGEDGLRGDVLEEEEEEKISTSSSGDIGDERQQHPQHLEHHLESIEKESQVQVNLLDTGMHASFNLIVMTAEFLYGAHFKCFGYFYRRPLYFFSEIDAGIDLSDDAAFEHCFPGESVDQTADRGKIPLGENLESGGKKLVEPILEGTTCCISTSHQTIQTQDTDLQQVRVLFNY